MFYENELWLTSPRQESSSFSATGCVPKVESDCCLKANNEAKFVERKVCFILEASNQWARTFTDGERGPIYRNSTVSSDSHLKIGHAMV